MNYDPDLLTPAPLNQKDILVDALFEQIFDDEYIEGSMIKPNTTLGYIDGIPCMLEWTFGRNTITITPLQIMHNQSWTDECIILRLTKYNDDQDCQTICDATEWADPIGPYKIVASYYYKDSE